MASKEREELLNDAQNVGLSVGVDFNKNITNEKLKNLIEEKKIELENQLKGNNSEQSEGIKNNSSDEINTEDKNKDDGVNDYKQSEKQIKTYEDEILIKRTSPCGNYRVQIKGIKECARRTNLTVEQVKESLENDKPVNGWNFKEMD